MIIKPHSANFFARLFIGVGLIIFIAINLSFYFKGNEIKNTVERQAQHEVQYEVLTGVNDTIAHLNQLANDVANWDELRQQLSDSSYYFYWRDQNLKHTIYFQPYYDQLEVYYPDGSRISGISKSSTREKDLLPIHLHDKSQDYLLLDDENTVHLLQFKPIFATESKQLIGYVGISSNFLSALFAHTQFFFTQKSSIQFDGVQFDKNSQLNSDQIMNSLVFAPIENPVNEYLWQLIITFMVQTTVIIVLLASIFFWLFSHLIHYPLKAAIKYLYQLKAHPNQLHTPEQTVYPVKEFSEINQSIYQFHSELYLAQIQLNQQNTLLWTQSRLDSLTNVFNRRAFDEAWHNVIEQEHSLFAFVLFDCDFFKALNDTYGHEVGDEVIRITAQTISDSLISSQLVVYRIGGDEFVVLIENETSERVKEIIHRCLDALINYPFSKINIREKLSFSVGIGMITPDISYPLTELPRQADIAMYKAKQSLQDKVQFYTNDMENDANAVLLKNDSLTIILDAIHTGQHIQMHYQPIIPLTDGRLYYESLIRLDTTQGRIFPNDIFTVVNRRRLEIELDKQVIQKNLLAFTNKIIPIDSGVSINISGKTLLNTDLITLFSPFLPYIHNYKIVIEVTETSLIEHFDYVSEALQQLRKLGFLIALDDFGSGYSSIRYLANMPVDIIKFDMSLLRALENGDTKTQAILYATANMIVAAGYQLVIEGVETEAQVQLTKQLGASHVQGYYFGKPSPNFIVSKTIIN